MKKRKTKEPEPIPEVIPPEPEQPSQGSRVREGLENLTKAAVLRSEAPDRGAPYDVIRFPLSFRVVMIQEPQIANLQRKSIVPVSQSVYSMHHNQLPKFD